MPDRNPRTDPRPGDELGGKALKVKVLSISLGETGITSIELVGASPNQDYDLRYKYTFSIERWLGFVRTAEVLHHA